MIYALVGLAAVFILGVAVAYYVVMHTSVPFQALESMLTQANTNAHVKVEGLTGTISTGFKVRSIRWGEENAGGGEIQDVRVTYDNFWELLGGRRIVVREIHIGKAHLDVTGLEELTAADTTQAANVQNPFLTNSPWANAGGQRRRPGLELVQIDQVAIEDVFITNRVTGLGLTIPAIHWSGFKSANGQVELGRLEIDSDRLTVTTTNGRTVAVNGQPVAFQKLLQGTLLPRLHPSIRQPIAFTADVGCTQGKVAWRLVAFDGALEAYRGQDRQGFLHCTNLDLAAYFDGPIPQQLTLSGAIVPGAGSKSPRLDLSGGSFRLGTNHFEVLAAELEQSESGQTNQLAAVGHYGGEQFTYRLLVGDKPWKIQQSLESHPPISPQDTLAILFASKPYGDLAPAQRQEIDRKLSAFAGWGTKTELEKK
jgi:hypothetical protein